MNSRHQVDFFIVGAPKSGTTALFEYLKNNERVFLPDHKEPSLFAFDYPNIGGRIGELELYHKLYGAKKSNQIAGDVSVCYLGSKQALEAIHDYNPDAKIIVMLRNPIDLFLSEHSQLLYSFYESEKDPIEAWNLQAKRMKGEAIPSGCREPKILNYRNTCALGSNLERVYHSFPKEQVMTVLFDDFAEDTLDTYRQVLDFLGLPDDKRVNFPKVNERKAHRYKLLARLLISPPGKLARWHSKFRRYVALSNYSVVRSIDGLARKLLLLISREGSGASISPGARSELEAEFREEINKLEALIGKDLSAWKNS